MNTGLGVFILNLGDLGRYILDHVTTGSEEVRKYQHLIGTALDAGLSPFRNRRLGQFQKGCRHFINRQVRYGSYLFSQFPDFFIRGLAATAMGHNQ